MRRMITNKQIDDIEQGAVLDQYIKPSAPIPPLPEVPDVLVFNQYIDDFAESVEEGNYSVNFDSHTITEWYPEVGDQDHFAVAYFEMTDAIAFPDTIDTVEELAQWIKENWKTIIYTAVLEDESMYLESADSIFGDYAAIDLDTDNAEYETNGIHIEVTSVRYISTYLQNLKLAFGVDENLKINGVGEINSNQKIITTNNVKAKTVEGTDSVISKKINEANANEGLTIGGTRHYIQLTRTAFNDGGIDFHGNIEFSTPFPIFNSLLTVDPQIAGAIWNDNGTLKISAGPEGSGE